MRHFVWFFLIFLPTQFRQAWFASRPTASSKSVPSVERFYFFRSALVRKIKVSRSKLLVAFANCRTTNGDSLELRLCFRNRVQQFHCSDHIYFDATLICLSFF
uniref:(northern house mosquito) hypothetical protein n=1 Tax=Culex pipiens TaxID=7175 RepID=A0A8D8H6S8_CULPI